MKVGGEIVILIIIILGAFLIGGATYQGNDYVLPSSSTPGGSSSTPTPTPGGGTATWDISYVTKGCAPLGEQIEITAKGPDTGYITLEINKGSGFQTMSSDEFTHNPSVWAAMTLPKSSEFNTKPWRVRLFQGANSGGQRPDGD
ncbi:MAG: hypothetical protein CO136_02615, partial [Candidatus Levybacteria bacterium CG_4_9_14_3_um_filter_36_7]